MALGMSPVPSSPWLAPHLISGIAHSRRCRGKLILATSKRCSPIVNTKACGVRRYDLVMHRYFVDEILRNPSPMCLRLQAVQDLPPRHCLFFLEEYGYYFIARWRW